MVVTKGCSATVYHWTMIEIKTGPISDSKKPSRNLRAKTGGMLMEKPIPKRSCTMSIAIYKGGNMYSRPTK
jgi:hypothetical protein